MFGSVASPSSQGPSFSHRKVRLDTLVRLRWLAVAGQSVAVLAVAVWLKFPFSVWWCFGLIGLSAWLNLFLKIRHPSSRRLTEGNATLLLSFDILQLSGLLLLTGGLTNPFALLLLAPVTVSATALPPKRTALLGALAVGASCVLAVFPQPLPWFPGERLEFPQLYVLGIFLALTSSLAFIAVYAFRVAEEGRQLADALAATELVLAREQHLSALDGLAAAAAHELGTPLGTIVLTAKELAGEFSDDSAVAEDIALIRSQAERCREILAKLTSLSAAPDTHFDRMPISHILEEVVAPNRDFGVDIEVIKNGVGKEPVGVRNPAVLYGLGNLVENAADFAKEKVVLTAEWNDQTVRVTIADDGPGFAASVLDRLGEPYVTTRKHSEAEEGHSSGGGLGLGLFIAKTLLERTGAQVDISNRTAPETGAVVEIAWSRARLDFASGDDTNADPDEFSIRPSVAASLPDGL
ncbi:two-component system sensor histidine kinase RegB [Rhodobium orientis]|uniref:histidine kinase n=1 Tax=Rhodobium orientis TaxID=34017 RepID=A0A327JNU0_9HYPH|nr:ActS/PrrB/RegB family redox-sensitive histidine kinase [Rhodobium orientis]MBB4301944.1 two-component system sensor histidine kinase RegB [Rhodobium orientis]MBK5950181.1 two-component sensor histidine kinase [Rhodobium orientis]RAI27246.1 two-component sensor histidine kinase [Rhodobium orientis]